MNTNIKTLTAIAAIIILVGVLFFVFKFNNQNMRQNRGNGGSGGPNQMAGKNAPQAVDNSKVDKSMLTMTEVAKHTSDTDCWTVVNNNVYDITPYIPYHPGGKANIMRACGTDATAMFTTSAGREHSPRAQNLIQNYLVGPLVLDGNATN